MKKEDYVKTIYIEGLPVDVGMDDYGQCYYFEWFDGEKMCEESCGSYNTDYVTYIMFRLCPRYHELWKKDLLETLTDEEKMGVTYKQIAEYIETGKTEERAMRIIEKMNRNSKHKRDPIPMYEIERKLFLN